MKRASMKIYLATLLFPITSITLFAQNTNFTEDSLNKYSGLCFCESCLKAQKARKKDTIQLLKKNSDELKKIPKNRFLFVDNLSNPDNKIDTGQIYILKKVHFYGGVPVMKKEAYPELNGLILFLQQNPSIKISINGHVNGTGKNTSEFQMLSQDRANAVMFYLIKHGEIDKSRLTAIGFGNTKQIFTVALDGFEMEANRRVEIQIVAK